MTITPARTLLVTNGLVVGAAALLGPIYAIYVDELGGDILDAGFTFAVFSFAAGFASFLAGRYSDKIKETELVLVLGYIISGIAYFGYLLVTDIWGLFLVQLLIGFTSAAYWPAFDKLYSIHSRDREATSWGEWEGMNYILGGIGAVLGGLVVSSFGFDALFAAMGVLCIASGVVIYLLPRSYI